MLTRLQVTGFKNLVDVDVRFGPFTCVAGPNAVGKSNLFDAIGFLGSLADQTLVEAAKSVRGGRTADVRNLFHRVGDRHDPTMSFTAEMIIPEMGVDDLGQSVKAAITFVCYTLELALRASDSRFSHGDLAIVQEKLEHITLGEARQHLLFPHDKAWRESTVTGRRTAPFISTETDPQVGTRIKLHQDRGESGGRASLFLASTLPRTVLSSASAAESRTAVLVRNEMRAWRRLQLEPTAMREPDDFATRPGLGSDGSHLAATLYHLARGGSAPSAALSRDSAVVYARLANLLSELIDDVRDVGVDSDPQRELLTIFAQGKDGTRHPARALSDGTLRFLALAVLELDPSAPGVLCLEEPENGIHPARIPAMLKLLQDIATDTGEPIGPDNPLRQVIINTHSPVVVREVSEDDLVVARSRETVRGAERFQGISFACLPDTWRAQGDPDENEVDIVDKGTLLAYLSPTSFGEAPPERNGHPKRSSKKTHRPRRVIDREDLQTLLRFPDNEP